MTLTPASASQGFAVQLRKARKAAGMTQTDLAAATGLTRSMISLFESGDRKPSFDNLRLLVYALNVSADVLLERARIQGPTRS